MKIQINIADKKDNQMHPAEATRYPQLKESSSVNISALINPILGMHGIHNSDGSVFAVRYKNSGQSADFLKNGERYYYLFNTNFFGYDINESSSSNSFSVTKGGTETAEAFLYGNQFGYNFHFKENTVVDFSIYVGSGEYSNNNSVVNYEYTDSDGNHYRVDNPSEADLSDFTINYEEIEV